MRYVTLVVAAGLILAVTATAGATTVTLTFDPNDLIDLSPASAGTSDVNGQNKATQVNARRIHQPWGTVYETFYNPSSPSPQPDSYNTYMNWRDSLGEGEGIAMFNNWMIGWSGAPTWGETWVVKPGTTSGTSASGWNFRIVEHPYRAADGDTVQWWTTDSTKYLRPGGTDIGMFSVTADLYKDTNANGMWDAGDVGVSDGDTIRMWFGDLNGDDAPYYRSDTQALYFDDQGWGTRTPNDGGPWSAIYANGANDPLGSGFEATLSVTAVVPEPLTMLAVFTGIAGLAGYVRKRKMA